MIYATVYQKPLERGDVLTFDLELEEEIQAMPELGATVQFDNRKTNRAATGEVSILYPVRLQYAVRVTEGEPKEKK